MQVYSTFFKTLHDETSPTGHLGRGTHYSVLRAMVFHDSMGRPLPDAHVADFAVIWDEDHDARVIEPIEEIFCRGLLSSFVMFGERKGVFTAIPSKMAIPPIEELPINPAFLHRVNELELSIRSDNCLKNEGVDYIGDLVHKTEAELLRTQYIGRKSVNEIKEALAQMGLHLGMEILGWPELREQFGNKAAHVEILKREIKAICQSLDDPWPSQVVAIDSPSNPIIDDENEKVHLYLRNLEMLWRLGTAARRRPKPTTSIVGLDRRI
jgi:hypothetical protein